MATLTIRQLDDTVYDRLKTRARANNRSVEAEARQILGERTTRSKAQVVADLEAFHARMAAKLGPFSDSVELIRAIRDEE